MLTRTRATESGSEIKKKWSAWVVAVAAALGLWGASPTPARADNIDHQLIEQLPKIMKFLKDKNYANVGVLPFRVQKGNQPPKFNVGSISHNLAGRLETGLVLVNDAKKPVGILKDPAKTAANGKGASYMTEAGRRGLLAKSYPMAWGQTSAKPDAFLTGDVEVNPNNKFVRVVVKAFDRSGKPPVEVVHFTTKTDRSILADLGQSYSTRRVRLRSDQDETEFSEEKDKAAAESTTENDNGQQPPQAERKHEVTLTIQYNGQPAPIEDDPSSPGEKRVSPPRPGQEVSFVLENKGGSETYAVVLKVNGQNTLFLEEQDAIHCTKWILAPGKRTEIKGYYKEYKGQNLLPFRVVDPEAAKEHLDKFPAGAAEKIDFYVFSQHKGQMTVGRKVDLRSRSLAARDRTSLASLQAKLRSVSHTDMRGGKLAVRSTKAVRPRLIVPGETLTAGSELQETTFENAIEADVLKISYKSRAGD